MKIVIMTAALLAQGCGLKYMFFKDKATPEIISQANEANQLCDKDIKQCVRFIHFTDMYDLDISPAQTTGMRAKTFKRMCLKHSDDSYCKRAWMEASKVDDYKMVYEICNQTKDSQACYYAGEIAFETKQDSEIGNRAYVLGCESGDRFSCNKSLKKAVEEKSEKYLAEGCKRNSSHVCYVQALFGKEMGHDPRLRKNLYTKACQLKSQEACEALTLIDYSVEVFDCEVKNMAESCDKIANAALAKKELTTAERFFKLSCERKNKDACDKHHQVLALIQTEKANNAAMWGVIANGFAAGFAAGAGANSNPQASSYSGFSNSSNDLSQRTPASNHAFGCGIKPIPQIGCEIGRCLRTGWEQVCNSNPTLTCGIAPIPRIGCKVGRCISGTWEQVCDSNSTISCGIPPIPQIGCKIGRCTGSGWEQVCN